MAKFFLVALIFISALALSADPTSFSLQQIPDGYPAGRKDAPKGAYSTPFYTIVHYATYASMLERKVYGLANLSKEDEVTQAKAAYYLESLCIGLIKNISEEEYTNHFESEALLSKLRDIYARIRVFQERMYEIMIRRVDVALPGPNGLQLREELKGSLDPLYACNCRQDTVPTPAEQKAYYEKKLKDFFDKGGSLSELHLLNDKYLRAIKGVIKVEYVERENGEVWVTEGRAGHVVLAEGKKVKSAGQMVIVKGGGENISLFVSSNASGTYKPDLYSVKRMVKRLEKTLNKIEIEKTNITSGDPLGTQNISVLMKAQGVNADTIKDEVKKLEVASKKMIETPENYFPKASPTGNGTCMAKLIKISDVQPLSLTYSPK